MSELKSWQSITRNNPFKVTISEKIDGVNVCIVIGNGLIQAQSRTRVIYRDDDLHGFAKWVELNKADLLELGDGCHVGEWAGAGIRKNPSKLECKHFFLFNTHRWSENRPTCCDVVPIIFEGIMNADTVPNILREMKMSNEMPNSRTIEGVCVYYHTFDKYTKHTVISPNGKWCKS